MSDIISTITAEMAYIEQDFQAVQAAEYHLRQTDPAGHDSHDRRADLDDRRNRLHGDLRRLSRTVESCIGSHWHVFSREECVVLRATREKLASIAANAGLARVEPPDGDMRAECVVC